MSGAVVVGAGPAGLTAAYELSKLGLSSTLLEADHQVGGLSRTAYYNGYRFDIGGHRFFSKIPEINDLWEEILDEDFLLRPRLSRIFYNGHFFDYPLKAFNALVGLGPIEALLVCLSYGQSRVWPSAEERNFEQWVSNRFGSRLYEIFFKTYTEKVWGMSCSEISADWAAQRIKDLSLREALYNAIVGTGKGKDGQVITTLIEQFHYPRLGPGMMWECCRDRLAERGNPTLLDTRVERIRHHNNRVQSVIARSATGERFECDGDRFISTMPLRELVHALDPAPPDAVRQAANQLRYRDYLTVVLIVNRDSVFPDNWLYIHAPEVKMGRIQNYKNWSPEMVPTPAMTSLGLEYFLWDHDEEWEWPDERLIELGVRECAQIGLIEPREVVDGTVVRMRKAYPIYDQDYQTHIATIRQYLDHLPNLQTIGRNGLHRYNNQDHSMLTGLYAARNIVGDERDVWSVNTEQTYHETETAETSSVTDRAVPTRVAANIKDDGPTSEALIEAAFAELDPIALGTAVGVVVGGGGPVCDHHHFGAQRQRSDWTALSAIESLSARLYPVVARGVPRYGGGEFGGIRIGLSLCGAQ